MIASSLFIFLVMAELPSDLSILLLNGIFFGQSFIDSCCCLFNHSYKGYKEVYMHDDDAGKDQTCLSQHCESLKYLIEHKIVKAVAFIFQLIGLTGFILLWLFQDFLSSKAEGFKTTYLRLRLMLALPLCLIFCSVIWTNKFQEKMHKSKIRKKYETEDLDEDSQNGQTARYKSCMFISR